MEFHQLRYFEAAARLGSMVAAALECRVAQPSLSVQIRRLEEELGTPLFVRQARGVALTDAGVQLVRAVRVVLGELGAVREQLRAGSRGETRVWRLSVLPYVATEILPTVLHRLGAANDPDRWAIRERTWPRVLESLVAGEVDFALTTLPDTVPAELEATPLFSMPYRAFCPRQHPLAAENALTVARLAEVPVIAYHDFHRWDQRLAAAGAAQGKPPHIPFVSDLGISAFEMVAAGLGVAVLPACFSPRARRRRLRELVITDAPERLPVALCRRRGTSLPPELERLQHQIRALYGAAWA